ncbi:MAG: uncharacterized protein JWQ51_3354 [Tardiphaga sp.]|nr:uncharacterized protein [Tardiphaga sp.]
MRASTVAEAMATIQSGTAGEVALAECVDSFDPARTADARYGTIADGPALTGDPRLDALAGAIAEYPAKQRQRGQVPAWASVPRRNIDLPWFTTTNASPAMREYLAFSSPVEFASRDIFTDERPLRRARGHLGAQDIDTA